MEFVEIKDGDYEVFHDLLTAYYREGEDADTPQEVVDEFIQGLFDEVTSHAIEGCFAREGETPVGFALWALDTEDFAYSEMPGFGAILEIGVLPAYRLGGRGAKLVAHVEAELGKLGARECYASAYGPAQAFWAKCGYRPSGKTASSGLPILVKAI